MFPRPPPPELVSLSGVNLGLHHKIFERPRKLTEENRVNHKTLMKELNQLNLTTSYIWVHRNMNGRDIELQKGDIVIIRRLVKLRRLNRLGEIINVAIPQLRFILSHV